MMSKPYNQDTSSAEPIRCPNAFGDGKIDCPFVKYNPPVKLEKKTAMAALSDPSEECLKLSASNMPPDICKMMVSTEKPADEKTRKLLAEEFPVRVKKVNGEVYVSAVRDTQASRMEIQNLLNDLQLTLTQRAARRAPLCQIREEVLSCVTRELLRQLIIECPERGLLFKQVIEEYNKYFDAYEVLLRHNEAFMCRKNLQAIHTRNAQQAKIQHLEGEIDVFKQQLKALKEAAERMEKKYNEEKMSEETKRQNEVRYLTQLGEQLKSQMEVFAPGMEE